MSLPLDPDLVLRGYASGIFPMADDRASDDLFWVEPRARAILPPDRFHCSRSLAKRLRSGRFTVTADRDFAGVLLGCADRDQTWINGPIEHAMLALHARAQAHSVEVWLDEALVGGVYGVVLGRAFFADGSGENTLRVSFSFANDQMIDGAVVLNLGGIKLNLTDVQAVREAAVATDA